MPTHLFIMTSRRTVPVNQTTNSIDRFPIEPAPASSLRNLSRKARRCRYRIAPALRSRTAVASPLTSNRMARDSKVSVIAVV